MMLEYDKIRQICAFLNDKCEVEPQVVVVLGSGLDKFSEAVEPISEIPYGDIPYIPVSTVQSHAGSLLVGRLNGKVIAVMRGRVHLYEKRSQGVGVDFRNIPCAVGSQYSGQFRRSKYLVKLS